MGAFGVGPFENDDAADWAQSLIESGSVDSVAETLLEFLFHEHEHLEAPKCSKAVAAAEVVAALNGFASSDLPSEIRRWAEARFGPANAELIPPAERAVSAVMTRSELEALWKESDQAEAWLDRMIDLTRRLKPQPGARP